MYNIMLCVDSMKWDIKPNTTIFQSPPCTNSLISFSNQCICCDPYYLYPFSLPIQLIGLSVMIIGIWASVDTDNHTSITEDDDNYTGVAVLLIVVGLFVLAVGIGGIVGAIFASTICGRIILGIVSG